MFADGRTRITLLAVVFITSMMLTFSDSFFQRRREYAPAVICRKKAVELTSPAISSFRDGVMITGARDAMRVDLVTCDQKTRSCSHSKNIAFNPQKSLIFRC